MRRALSYLTIMVLALLTLSCEKSPDPISIDFSSNLYKIYVDGTTEIELQVGTAPEAVLNIPLTFSGKAVKGTDYSVSAESVQIQPGETSGSIKVTNISLSDEKQVAISFTAPEGYKPGNRFKAVLSLNKEEALIYQFKMKKANLHESYIAEIELKGTKSGKDSKAAEAISVPLRLTGEGAGLIQAEAVTKDTPITPSPEIIVPAGSNHGQIRLSCNQKDFKGKAPVVLSVNTQLNPRFIPADQNSEQEIAVWGALTPDRLEGTWEFVKIYNQDELEMWFSEMEDDPALLPTHNQGFQISFSKGAKGCELIPNDKGDFAHFFRKSSITSTTPKNTCAKSVSLGSYSAEEMPMFMAADGYTHVQNWYYELSNANRAFDSASESLGKSIICISLIDENTIQVQLRDYDAPPFSIMWWDNSKFDPDMFGFASEFKKIK